MPYYCDYTVRKSAWSRLTEFLGLLGGLYTTFISLGLIIWFILVHLPAPLPPPPPPPSSPPLPPHTHAHTTHTHTHTPHPNCS